MKAISIEYERRKRSDRYCSCVLFDFGQLAVGDPACDLAINWTLFQEESRKAFKKRLCLDQGTWDRARGWTLWKALVVDAGLANPNNLEAKECWLIIEDVLTDDEDSV